MAVAWGLGVAIPSPTKPPAIEASGVFDSPLCPSVGGLMRGPSAGGRASRK